MSRPDPHPICGPGCRYRGLYEGTQMSLSDMAGKQAVALGRVGRLRNGIVYTLKGGFPRDFADAERQIGARISSLDDEVLLAYLGSMVNGDHHASPGGIEALRAVLAELGFTVPTGSDLGAWADILRDQRDQRRVDELANLFAADPTPVVPVTTDQPRRRLVRPQAPTSEAVPAVPATTPSRPRRGRKPAVLVTANGSGSAAGADDLTSLFIPPSPVSAVPAPHGNTSTDQVDVDDQGSEYVGDLPAEFVEVPFDDFDSGQLADGGFPDDPPFDTTGTFDLPVASGPTTSTSVPAVPGAPTPPPAGAGDTFRRRLVRPEPSGQGGAQELVTPVAPATTNPTNIAVPASTDTTLQELFDTPAPSVVTDPPTRTNRRRPARNSGKATDPAKVVPGRTPAGQETTLSNVDNRAKTVDKPESGKTPTENAPVGQTSSRTLPAAPVPVAVPPTTQAAGTNPTGPPATSGPATGKAPARPQVFGLPLRPELLLPAPAPKAYRRRNATTKVPRTAALPPDAQRFDVPPESLSTDADELTDDMRQALLAMVSIPRPVFAADLVHIAGSSELVATWETEMRETDNSPVRFIPPKSRHLSRGSLILPYDYHRSAATEFTRSVWGEAMKKYRGAKLYELAVLIHRMNEEIVGHRLGDETVLLRLNQPNRGLVGISVVLDNKLGEDESTRQHLVADLKELMSERLTLVAVLTVNEPTLQPTIESITAEADRHRWDPPMPVIAAKSWEYAENRGSSAVLVLGGPS
jgi:hypothetical protein